MNTITYKFKTDDKWYEAKGSSFQTLLEISESAQVRTPHACEEGGCGSCRGKLLSGRVEMKGNDILEKDELDAGLVLACQARAITDEVVIDFDAADSYQQ